MKNFVAIYWITFGSTKAFKLIIELRADNVTAARPIAKNATVRPVKTVSSQENKSAPKTKRTTGIRKTIKIAAAGKVKNKI